MQDASDSKRIKTYSQPEKFNMRSPCTLQPDQQRLKIGKATAMAQLLSATAIAVPSVAQCSTHSYVPVIRGIRNCRTTFPI